MDRRVARSAIRIGGWGPWIAIITLVIVAGQFAIVMLILWGGKSSRARNEKVIRENNAARTYIKRELADD